MNALVVDDDLPCGRFLAEALSRAGYHVQTVQDGKSAIKHMSQQALDVVVCDWMLPDIDGISVLRWAKKSLPEVPTLILISGLDGPGAKKHAQSAGADDFLVKPITALKLLESVELARARREVRGTSSTRVIPEIVKLKKARAWSQMEASASRVLAESIGLELRPSSGRALSGDEAGAVLEMVDVQQQLCVLFGVYVSLREGKALARVMLQEEDAEASLVIDLLGELCNTVLGALKRELAAEAFDFTLSVADDSAAPRPEQLAAMLHAPTRVTLEGTFGALTWIAGVRSARCVTLGAAKLRENMVLAEDLFNDAGVLVLPKGTRLTSASAQRLGWHFPHRSVKVWARDAA